MLLCGDRGGREERQGGRKEGQGGVIVSLLPALVEQVGTYALIIPSLVQQCLG